MGAVAVKVFATAISDPIAARYLTHGAGRTRAPIVWILQLLPCPRRERPKSNEKRGAVGRDARSVGQHIGVSMKAAAARAPAELGKNPKRTLGRRADPDALAEFMANDA